MGWGDLATSRLSRQIALHAVWMGVGWQALIYTECRHGVCLKNDDYFRRYGTVKCIIDLYARIKVTTPFYKNFPEILVIFYKSKAWLKFNNISYKLGLKSLLI